MGINTKLMSIVLPEPIYTREYASDKILFHTFTTAQTNTVVWTPEAGKSIFLTALQVSSAVPITIQLNRASNAPFSTIMLTGTFATYSESFPSPIQFEADEAISVTTNAAGAVYLTLMGYEL